MTSKQMAYANNGAGRMDFDGIWKSEDNKWMITCVHGNFFGDLTLQWDGIFFPVTPDSLRGLISLVSKIDIPKEECLIITPCYPKEATEKYEAALKKNNISILGNWRDQSTIGVDDIRNKFYVASTSKIERIKENEYKIDNRYIVFYDDIAK